MAHDNQNDLNRLWQDQPAEEVRVTLEDIRHRAYRLETRVGRRNLREYAAAVFVLVFVGVFGTRAPSVSGRMACGLIALGTLYVVYHLHKYGSVRSMPSDLALKDCLDFHREELVRQRDLLRSVWWWYLLPFAPGLAFILIGSAIERPYPWPLGLGVATVFVAAFVAIGRLNQRAALKLQRRIDDLDQARG